MILSAAAVKGYTDAQLLLVWHLKVVKEERIAGMSAYYLLCQVICEQHNRATGGREWDQGEQGGAQSISNHIELALWSYNHAIISALSCPLEDKKLFLPQWFHRLKTNRCEEKVYHSYFRWFTVIVRFMVPRWELKSSELCFALLSVWLPSRLDSEKHRIGTTESCVLFLLNHFGVKRCPLEKTRSTAPQGFSQIGIVAQPTG